MKKLLNTLLYCGLDEDDYKQVLPDVIGANKNNLVLFSGIASVILAILYCLTYFVKTLRIDRTIYLLGALRSIVVHFTIRYFLKSTESILVISYIFIVSVLSLGISMGTLIDSQFRAVTFIAIMIAIPLLISDVPYRMCSAISIADIIFIFLVIRCKPEKLWVADVVNGIAYGIIGIAGAIYTSKTKFERYLFEKEAKTSFEKDMLTGLKNRNSYETTIHSIFGGCKESMVVVYFDVNGLHDVNNNQGHLAGDKMLRTVASQIQSVFGEEYSFRVGGDEFIAVAYDKTDREIDNMLYIITQGVSRDNYNVSTGYAHCHKNDGVLEDAVKEAEQFMYARKREYYQNSKNDRRNRR